MAGLTLIPWVGGKGKLLWLLHKLAPPKYARFIDVFGGGGTVTLNHPIRAGCLEVYNDYNSDLTNLFFCAKERPLSMIRELGFLPLNSRDDFTVLTRALSREPFFETIFQEELELTEVYFDVPDREVIRQLLLQRAPFADVRRAANYYKVVRYSFSGGTKSFGGRSCNLANFYCDLWDCSRRLQDVVIENKDFESLIRQYDREDAFIYCDPPYFEAEGCYKVEFPKEDHRRLHRVLSRCRGFVMVSYNYCPFVYELYRDFYIFYTKRQNSMSQTPGSEYEEVVMTNYDPRVYVPDRERQLTLFPSEAEPFLDEGEYILLHEPTNEMED